jgi:adenylate cyclase
MATPTLRESKPVEGTIVFTDIVGFTEFTATRGDTEALQLLATQDRLVQSALPDGARIVKELGDGLLLWFPDPVAALRSAFALHRAFEAESSATGLPLWIRVGMHHGRALQRGADVIGHDVNVAARIVDVAAPGEVLVSDAVQAGVDPRPADVCFTELGPVVMKGISGPIRLWRATPC